MLCSVPVEHTGYQARKIVRHKAGAEQITTDSVAEETPVALVYNGISHAVMMATPLDLEEFAVGFTLTEGIVSHSSEIYEVEVSLLKNSAEVQLEISQRAFAAMKERRRALAGRTGCGVCGIESIELLDLVPRRMPEPVVRLSPSRDMIERAAASLPSHQRLMQATGGVHAAAWCNASGEVMHVFEDVGRHNGLDKLVGYLMMRRVSLDNGFVFLSSRASYELVRKAARMNIQLLATISAPTSLAIQIAELAGLRLLSFCRKDGYVDYTSLGQDSPANPR
ncbi:formate dehydrogenase accessory sulfurtransferase FdhD [Noviherbaspirillum saxi]|uniref:Sulfur carrier protein FdhD n=1 Tax=Noviherbaspirillum saxi TaxID=2320863 RepID=A0A3A3FEY8_9BURK|nr:formate dehydrogenase accessory sulfurtransferase FdhD [Noviherbaspirillum saxi]RJF91911.1 formate dehydrogenase accessory sulfurtransferase FdhD [Noviherbaspirillum saxi]